MRARRAAILLGAAAAGCGLNVQAPDLFVLTRTGQGHTLTELFNYAGTVACNGGPAKELSDPLLLQARDLTTTLDADAKAKLRIAPAPDSVYLYTIKLEHGTISFPDTAGLKRPELAQVQQLALQAAQQACGLSA
jgi:hypothetical protein